MTEGASHFGIKGSELNLSKGTVLSELQAGHPIICSMRPGDFTSQGHFIVLVGVQDGKIIVNDPNSTERSNVLWDFDVLQPQIKNLWAFKK
jgi:predicted double-glycine peptidase